MSLGSSCAPKRYIDKYVAPSETNVFDYIGTPLMWSINSLLENRWASIADPELMQRLQFFTFHIFNMKPSFVTNTRYYIQFAHDAIHLNETKKEEFQAKMKRRTDRFDAKMRGAKRILFIRQKGDISNESRKKYNRQMIESLNEGKPTEEEAMNQFIPLVKSIYGCPSVTMIYLNDERDGWNEDATILSVKCDINMNYTTSHTVLDALFKQKDVYTRINEAGTFQTPDPTA
jgi:hypothetical protein